MRRIIAAVTAAAAALTLTGCAGEGAAIDGLRERLISAGAVTMDVEITSTMGGRLAEYGLSLERTYGGRYAHRARAGGDSRRGALGARRGRI